jgi:hypothetical protein
MTVGTARWGPIGAPPVPVLPELELELEEEAAALAVC